MLFGREKGVSVKKMQRKGREEERNDQKALVQRTHENDYAGNEEMGEETSTTTTKEKTTIVRHMQWMREKQILFPD